MGPRSGRRGDRGSRTFLRNALGEEAALKPEHLLLAILGGARPSPAPSNEVELWRKTFDLAERHRLLAPLAPYLQSIPLPDPERSRLLSTLRAAGIRNLELSARLVELGRCFDAKGIPFVPFKGPFLAERILGDLAARECFDADILVSPVDGNAGARALAELGYRAEDVPDDRHVNRWRSSRYEQAFVHGTHGTRVELHWSILPPFLPFGIDIEEVIQASLPARRASHFFLEPPLPMLALLLIAHGTHHCWCRLCWVHDLACLLPGFDHEQWRGLEELAARAGARRMLALCVDLLRRIPGLVLPAWHLEDPPRPVAAVGDAIAAAWFAPVPELLLRRRYRLCAACRERPRDRAHMYWRLLFQPTPADLQWIDLPRWLDWLYPALRPLRLLTRSRHRAPGSPSSGRE